MTLDYPFTRNSIPFYYLPFDWHFVVIDIHSASYTSWSIPSLCLVNQRATHTIPTGKPYNWSRHTQTPLLFSLHTVLFDSASVDKQGHSHYFHFGVGLESSRYITNQPGEFMFIPKTSTSFPFFLPLNDTYALQPRSMVVSGTLLRVTLRNPLKITR